MLCPVSFIFFLQFEITFVLLGLMIETSNYIIAKLIHKIVVETPSLIERKIPFIIRAKFRIQETL